MNKLNSHTGTVRRRQTDLRYGCWYKWVHVILFGVYEQVLATLQSLIAFMENRFSSFLTWSDDARRTDI